MKLPDISHLSTLHLLNVSREPYPTPCSDCGRTYLQGENVTLNVPTSDGNQRVIWTGCADCWVRRSDPATYNVAADLAEAIRLTVEYVGNDTLPAQEGWSWYDALIRYKPEMVRPFVEKPIILHAPPEQSNLVDHARRELELLGEEPETIEGLVKVVRAFANMGHSGTSAVFAIPLLHELLQFKNLKPLTDNPTEWFHHDEQTWGEEGGIWQNIRNSAAFSRDGGKTYTLVNEACQTGYPVPIHVSSLYKDRDD